MHEGGNDEDVEAAQHLLNDETKEREDDDTAQASSSNSNARLTLQYGELYDPRKDVWYPAKVLVSLVLLGVLAILSFAAVNSWQYVGIGAHKPESNTHPSTETSNLNVSATSATSVSTTATLPLPTEDVDLQDEVKPSNLGDRYLLDANWSYDAPAQTREYHWDITDLELNPDGVYRPMIVINGAFPGPLIEVNEGDKISVHVHNKAANSTSFHWHGLFQNGTNHMDGTVGITQCPIAPGTSFVYEFTVKGQYGTYWYHGHHGVQASDGLFGPLIIHSKQEQESRKQQGIEYTTDRVVMVSDHYYDLSSALLYQYLQPDRENIEPVPAAPLINGRGRRNCDDVPNRKCDNSTAGVGPPVFNLESGKSHRLRFINTGAFTEFQIQLDEHEFAVTEADGTDLVPEYYHRLKINPAQRYSVIVNANHTDRELFWLRARMVEHCFKEPNPELTAELHAVLQYVSSTTDPAPSVQTPTTSDWPEPIELQCRDMNTTELKPLVPNPPPQTADHQLFIRANFEIGDWRLSRGFFNTSSWRSNVTSPTLFRWLDGATANNASFTDPFSSKKTRQEADFGKEISVPAEPMNAGVNDLVFDSHRELVYQSTGTQVIDLLISNFDDGAHPFHLHGHKFWVLAGGKGYPPEQLSTPSNLNYDLGEEFPGTGPSHLEKLPGMNLVDPLYRDTVTVEGFGWALLRFVADNAGLWAFHCHISWHVEAGLLMQFLVRGDELQHMKLPQETRDMCNAPMVESGRSPDDSTWFGSFPDRE